MKKNKFIVLLAIVIVFAFYGCNNKNNGNNTDSQAQTSVEQTTVTTTDAPTTAPTEIATNAATSAPSPTVAVSSSTASSASSTKNASVVGKWKPYAAVNANTNKSESLSSIYGTAYTQYGGELTFNSDKTFSIWIGVSATDGSGEGTYKISGNTISVSFDNNTKATYQYISNYQGHKAIKTVDNTHYIYFIKE
ncbi:MAG: hypothetical protein Q8876_04585 [Bacillota bacterium]|nr:hypothetical protein [Bacillota bacterium]